MLKRYKLTIRGRVQGVWFRGSAQRKARELGVNGFVKNMPDGSVYAEAEASEEALRAFVNWCRTGPELARVESVDVQAVPSLGSQDFEVLR